VLAGGDEADASDASMDVHLIVRWDETDFPSYEHVITTLAIHKLKLNCYTCDALNKPVWRELTCVACT